MQVPLNNFKIQLTTPENCPETDGIFLSSTELSTIEFGDHNHVQYSDPLYSEIIYLPYSLSSNSWFLPIKTIVFGSFVKYTNANLIINLATDNIYGPYNIVYALFEYMLGIAECETSDFKFLICPCSNLHSFPNLTLIFDEESIDIHHDLIFIEEEAGCRLLLTYHELDYWIIGKPILFDYYTIFDIDQQQIGLIYSKTHPIDVIEGEEEESAPILTNDELYMLVYIICGYIAIFLAARAAYVCSSRCGKSEILEENLEPLMEDNDAQEIAKFRLKKEEALKRALEENN